MIASWQESYDKPRQSVEKQRYYPVDKDLYSQGYGLPSVMYSCESWTINKADAKESMPSNCNAGEDSWKSLGQQGDQTSLKENQPCILVGRTDAKAKAPVFWLSDVNSWLIKKSR